MSAVASLRWESCPTQPVRWHEFADIFPFIEGEAFNALVEDIRQHGVREPIVMLDGAVLDGRNRYMAARQLGIEYPIVEYEGDDPLGFVISMNLARRHLSESQRAMVASKLANMRREDTLKQNAVPQICGTSRVTNADAARMFSVSPRSVETARAVREASPDLAQKVEGGALSVSLAEKVTHLPDEDREAVISAPPAETRSVARDAVKKAHVAHNSGENEWYTPDAFLDRARAVLGGFDLDPASSAIANERVRADRYFTAEDDGLSREWDAKRIWMNPPYAQPLIGQFCDKFSDEVERGASGIVLVNNATETAWFQRLASVASAICFPRSRVRFLDPEGNPGAPLQGQAVVYAGDDPDGFCAEFCGIGFVVLLHRGGTAE